MKLRWFSTCNKDGVWSSMRLQYWDEEEKSWTDIPYVSCKTWEEEQYTHNEFAI